MFRLLVKLSSLFILASVITGCAAGLTPVTGVLFTEVAGPLDAGAASGGKKGMAKCTSILGAVATGDCSIEAAKRAGGISQVASVDYKTRSILGLFAEVTTVVTGR